MSLVDSSHTSFTLQNSKRERIPTSASSKRTHFASLMKDELKRSRMRASVRSLENRTEMLEALLNIEMNVVLDTSATASVPTSGQNPARSGQTTPMKASAQSWSSATAEGSSLQ